MAHDDDEPSMSYRTAAPTDPPEPPPPLWARLWLRRADAFFSIVLLGLCVVAGSAVTAAVRQVSAPEFTKEDREALAQRYVGESLLLTPRAATCEPPNSHYGDECAVSFDMPSGNVGLVRLSCGETRCRVIGP